MNSVIHLSSSEGHVDIHIGDLDWCPCVLFYDGKVRYLGAASWAAISSSLLSALERPWDELEQPVVGEIEGQKVKHVLFLWEAHHILFVAPDGERRILFWQDQHSVVRLICAMRLSQYQMKAWRTELRSYANR